MTENLNGAYLYIIFYLGSEQGIIVKLAIKYKTSPGLAAKIILEEYLKEDLKPEELEEYQAGDKKAYNVLR